jgi:hypothetical protein
MKPFLVRLYWFFSAQLGLDFIRLFYGIIRLPRFLIEYIYFSLSFRGNITFAPCLHDRYESPGSIQNEYFWQDLHASQYVFDQNPSSLLDIGSRIDGYVAHVASFRTIDFVDIRPFSESVRNINFICSDISSDSFPFADFPLYDFISCLHVLEHVGLGRYGDTINLSSYKMALRNISLLSASCAKFVLSVPIGRERVDFNANRIFNPAKLVHDCYLYNFNLISFSYFLDNQSFSPEASAYSSVFHNISNVNYALGFFVFAKT